MSAERATTLELKRIFSRRSAEPSRTLDELQRLQDRQWRQLNNDEKYRLLAARAAALTVLNRFSEAVAVADEAEQLVPTMREADGAASFELRRIRGRQALHGKLGAEALRLSLKNIDEAERLGDEQLIGLAHADVAAVYGTGGDMRKALQHLQQSLQRTPETETLQYGKLLNNLGMVYLSVNRTDEAIACFEKARKTFRSANNDLQIAVTLANEGLAFEKLGDYGRAVELQERARAIFENGNYKHYTVASLYKLGTTMAKSGRATEAEGLYRQALELAESSDAGLYEDEAREAYGKFLLEAGRPGEAVSQFQRMVDIAQEGGTNQYLTSALSQLGAAQEAAGLHEDALATMKQLVQIQDRLENEPARSSFEAEVTELELSLERQVELVSATASALVEANRRLAEQARDLQTLAATDHLTSLWNRRHFMEKLEAALHGSRSNDGRGFSLLFLDIDGFKAVNDRFGHEAGDLVLQRLSGILQASVRTTDVVARWGGEEFAVLLPGADLAAAERVVSKVQAAITGQSWPEICPDLKVTISAGLISGDDHRNASADDIIGLVDRLLYAAKAAGRNQVVRADSSVAG